MPKPSAFMVRLQENQRHNMHLQRLFTIQLCDERHVQQQQRYLQQWGFATSPPAPELVLCV